MRTGKALLVIAAAGLAAAGCGGGSSGKTSGTTGAPQHPSSLVGDVGHGDAFVISLKDPSGAKISNLAAGTYNVTVNDESGIHDFHLNGGGVDKATTVPGTGTQTWKVTFTPGTYTFVCDPHSSQMHGSFKVS